jgi:hypothetical protein
MVLLGARGWSSSDDRDRVEDLPGEVPVLGGRPAEM